MLISERFEGREAPFEGDRLLMLRNLPEGAQVTNAIVTLTPVAPRGGVLFEERITFSDGQGDWGAQKREGSTGNGTNLSNFIEVDFHARRTLSSVTGSNLNGAKLQVDIGGLYIPINVLGAMSTPDDNADDFILTNDAEGLLPSLVTQKFKLTKISQPKIGQVGICSTPSNLTLHLGSQPSFWARPGELAQAETVPDFSVILNTFLAETQANDGAYEIPLTLHSDTLCRLDVDVEIEFFQSKTALPGGISEAALAFDHSTLPQGEGGVISVQLPAGARVLAGQTSGRLRGSFGNSRVVYGPTGRFEPAGVVKITPDRAQASPLIFSENLALSSLDLLLTSTSRTAGLAIDLVEDLDGKPATNSVLPTQVHVDIDSQIAGKPTWISVSLPVEVQVAAGKRLWLVVMSLRGQADWSVVSQAQVGVASASGVWTAGEAVAVDETNGAPLGVQYTDTGGLSWRAETSEGVSVPLVGMVHLRQPSARYQVPIELQVGDGDNANRVDLSRFEPLGQVDFNLDFAEFAEAINQAATASTAVSPPVGEHLLNNEFEDWRQVGDTPHEPAVRIPAGDNPARALAVSPDGRFLYIVNSSVEDEGNSVQLAIVETTCHELEDGNKISLGAEEFVGMAVSPDGHRAYILQDDKMTWVDLEARSLLGVSGELGTLFGARGKPIFSPDGRLLYVLYDNRIVVLDTLILDTEFAGEKNIEMAVADVITIQTPWQPVFQALSPDGSRLYVIVLDTTPITDTAGSTPEPRAELWIYSITFQSWVTSIDLGRGERFHLAPTLDGSRVIVASGSAQEVMIFEARRSQLLDSISTGDRGSPVAVAIDPAGRFVYVAIDEMQVVTGFDLSRLSLGFRFPDIPIGSSPSDMAILPSGEQLYVADERDSTESGCYLSSLMIGMLDLEEWTLTSGQVHRYCASRPFKHLVVLGYRHVERKRRGVPGYPTAISQIVPVAGGVRYELSFWGWATSDEAVAEVFWYGGDCGVQQIDRLPFQVFELQTASRETDFSSRTVSMDLWIPEGFLPVLHRLEMVSPPGAELAEVRFSVPANQIAILDMVSLQATANALLNGDLQHLEEGRLVGWNLVPEGVIGVTLIAEADGLLFRNNGTREAALEQAVSFPAQTPFELNFIGRAEASASGAAPQVELAWLGADVWVGSALSATILAQGSNRVARRGQSPVGADTALLRLVVPAGAYLLIQGIKFEEVQVTSVPIYVIAQAPGELNISNLQIAYEVALPAPPRTLPPGGLCPPTPPGSVPGQGSRGRCYCPNCGETDELCDTHESETSGGQPTLEGECCHCGARVQQIGGGGHVHPAARVVGGQPAEMGAFVLRSGKPPVVVRAPLQTSIRRRVALQVTSVRAAPVEPASATRPITNIRGISTARAQRLAEAGIDSLEKLATARPEAVARVLRGVSTEMAMRFIEEAKNLVVSTG